MSNDYIVRATNRARYLPAGQGGTHAMPYRTKPLLDRPAGLPAFMGSLVDLDFLDTANPWFRYDRALYSAGQHIDDTGNMSASVRPGMFTRRPGVTILTDSGGLQFARGKPWLGTTSQEQSLRFAEANGDEAIGLDIPTLAISLRHPLFGTFAACLATTLDNNRYWLANRTREMPMLAVLQGRDIKEARAWVTAAMAVPMTGWAFGGGMRSNYLYLAETLLRLAHAGLLGPDRNRVHVLGDSSLTQAVMLSALQRSLRVLQQDDRLQITFDTATPSVMVANGQAYRYATLTPDQFAMVAWAPPGGHLHASDRSPWCRSSEVGCRMTIGDAVAQSSRRQNGWDTLGNELVINHNIESLLRGIDDANSAMELPRGYQTPFAPPHVIGAYNALRTMSDYPRDPMGHLKRSAADFAKL